MVRRCSALKDNEQRTKRFQCQPSSNKKKGFKLPQINRLGLCRKKLCTCSPWCGRSHVTTRGSGTTRRERARAPLYLYQHDEKGHVHRYIAELEPCSFYSEYEILDFTSGSLQPITLKGLQRRAQWARVQRERRGRGAHEEAESTDHGFASAAAQSVGDVRLRLRHPVHQYCQQQQQRWRAGCRVPVRLPHARTCGTANNTHSMRHPAATTADGPPPPRSIAARAACPVHTPPACSRHQKRTRACTHAHAHAHAPAPYTPAEASARVRTCAGSDSAQFVRDGARGPRPGT